MSKKMTMREINKALGEEIEVVAEIIETPKPNPFEAKVDNIRVSVDAPYGNWGNSYPIRISILNNKRRGFPMGEFSRLGNCPGDVLSVISTKELIQNLEKAIQSAEALK